MSTQRETFGSRLGFILLSVGCAVGLGNVWRFPFIAGQYGGGLFVLLYIFFLAILGFPVLLMELSIGRAGGSGLVGSFRTLSGGKKIWVNLARAAFLGNVFLMMYYTTVTGWILYYAKSYVIGNPMLCGGDGGTMDGRFFTDLLASPSRCCCYMVLACLLGALLCSGSLRNTVERSAKYMMVMLFLLMICLIALTFRLPGTMKGLSFYLVPHLAGFSGNIHETIFAAMGQAFFTLSLGVGSMEIFGSYLGKDNKRSLAAESVNIIALDTLVAIMAGLIIFPICATFDVNVQAGPSLIFMSLPNLFVELGGGRVWGGLFFAFLGLAALSTVVAVFENMVAFLMDELGFRRRTAAISVGLGIALLSLPCALGFNVFSSFTPLGEGSTVLDLEDFIVSQNLLPYGSLLVVLFCVFGVGWGWKGFTAEAECGQKWRYATWMRCYCRWVLPLIMLAIFVLGYLDLFTDVFK